ncbi:poly [ADP-ribose] polymerase 1 isoform X1 [Hippocampus zosterae]|uniref:poly [ADP-ribose] polymerase 1 isoform X1 n=1 Tax=Hippocampus zosterae TaxID=109293 RepID=UPI00223DA38A|nr:poly [ADP-ribose] polymerase 1 isoform X1 [Hippocampus zosterae]
MADSQEDKLYKAEYAKSGRASCKGCKENIAKDSLRMAIMVQSPMFDGKVPHWHHFSCFWQRAAVQSPSDIDGFSTLRWEDQDKVKKAIESGGAIGGGKGGKKGGGAQGEKTLSGFAVEYAKSNRSTCKGCEMKIEKDQIRVSKKTVDPEKPQLGLIDRWYHTACFVGSREELDFKPEYSGAQLKGFNALRAEDKEELKKRLPPVKVEGKRKNEEVDGVSKKQKKEEEAETKKLEEQLKDQSQLIWGIKDKLRKHCSVNDMKELLIANDQEVPSGESNVVDYLGDGMAFGALEPCKECFGQLVFKGDAYYCTGNISAWTKCVFKTTKPARRDWVTPKEFHEVPFLKKFKFKRQDRIYPKEAPAPSQLPVKAEPLASASGAPAKPLPEGGPPGEWRVQMSSSGTSVVLTVRVCNVCATDKPLTGMKVLTVGKLAKNKDDIKAAVEELGGKICTAANKASLCISTKKEVEKLGKKMEEAKEAGVRVVSEDFLTDIKSSGKALQELVSLHAISPWGAEVKVEAPLPAPAPAPSKSGAMAASKSTGRVKAEEGKSKAKKMKLTVKGGAAVDPDSGLENSAHVLEQNGKMYSATLGLVDIMRGTNSYYKLQLLEDDVQKRYWVFRSWGRVGTTIGGNKLDKIGDKHSALNNFLSVYKEKTGNEWGASNFTKYPNKFYPLEIDYGQDEEAVKRLTATAGTKSKLAKPVQDLIKQIFDVESMKKAMVEFEIDLQKMPLGKLSKRQIQSAYALLTEVQQAVSDCVPDSHILDLSNRFYTLIPHDFGMKKPPLLRNLDYIQAKVQMLDNLLDIEVAYSLLRGGAQDNERDPIDINYEKLKTKIEVVDKATQEAEVILEYVKNTHAATHNTYTLEVQEIFKINREGERQRFQPFEELHNRQLLWHGSRTTNYAGILSQGLRIAPPEAPVTGYMFGKGVYFADMVSKSANYCHTSQSDPVGLLLLAEVALGNMHELKKASHITKLPKGKHSVKGLGRTAPESSATTTLDGVQVPLGKGANTNIDDASLLYNEYIVYDVAQINLKYLLKIKFNYQTSLW